MFVKILLLLAILPLVSQAFTVPTPEQEFDLDGVIDSDDEVPEMLVKVIRSLAKQWEGFHDRNPHQFAMKELSSLFDPYLGHPSPKRLTFSFVLEPMTMEDAHYWCEANEGVLPQFNSHDEFWQYTRALEQHMRTPTPLPKRAQLQFTWIGYSRATIKQPFKPLYPNQKSFFELPWVEGEPKLNNKHCSVYDHHPTFKDRGFATYDCKQKMTFACMYVNSE